MSVMGKIYAAVAYTLSQVSDFGRPTVDYVPPNPVIWEFVNGTGDKQANVVWSDQRTLAASATENLDFSGGITDQLGNVLAMTKVKALFIKAAEGNTNNVVVGGAGSNTLVGIFSDATDKIVIPPGGWWSFGAPKAGVTVTAGTGDILLVANSSSGTPVTYDIFAVGLG